MPNTVEGPASRLIDRELEEALWQHAGKWTAITSNKIVAVGDSPTEVLKELDRLDRRGEVFLHYVQDADTVCFF